MSRFCKIKNKNVFVTSCRGGNSLTFLLRRLLLLLLLLRVLSVLGAAQCLVHHRTLPVSQHREQQEL